MLTESETTLEVENLDAARFECVFPRCDGICCKNGRPGVEPAEADRIASVLPRVLPLLREEARREVERRGFLTNRLKEGCRTLAVDGGWCVFANGGCTLHRLGLEEGDAFRYKPWRCATFPLTPSPRGGWVVRQHDKDDEAWDIFCLSPKESPVPARESLRAELSFAEKLAEGGAESWRGVRVASAGRRLPMVD